MPRIEELVAKHKDYLSVLAEASEKDGRKQIRAAPVPVIKFIGDIAYNLQKGRLPLTPQQHKYFKDRKKLLKQIGDPYLYTVRQRRQALKQKGGNLSRALSKLILSAVKCPRQNHLAEAQQEGANQRK